MIRSDNGTEFKNSRFEDYCDEKGIKHEFSAKYTPEQNRVVERKNWTLINMARSMLSEYNVSGSFWAKAINTACHASNRLYCHRMLKKTPYELLIGRKSNISYFRVFGCKCYILRKDTRLSKFQSKYDDGFLLGYSLNSKTYRIYNQSSGLVDETSDVEFDETNGPQEKQENLDDVGDEGLRIAMNNMKMMMIHHLYFKFCHLPLIQAIKIKLAMWKEMKNQFINQLMILHPPLLKMQVLNSRFIMPLQKIILSIKLLVTSTKVFKLDLILLSFVNITILFLVVNLLGLEKP
jgi:hypothetical protein